MSVTLYHPFYCEENIWHLAQSFDRGDVVFISNTHRCVALWNQRAGSPVFWDYHVVFLVDGQLHDLDSTLGCPVPLSQWVDGTFGDVPGVFAPRFRVVSRERFVETFASDRSHMRSDEGWRAPPPTWTQIGAGMNLMRFVDVDAPFEGEVVDLAELVQAKSA